MIKTFDFTKTDRRTKQIKNVGSLTFQAEDHKAVLNFYGDICSSTWDTWYDDDKCPQDISDFLQTLNHFAELDIHINSGGGDVFAGVAIYNLLKRHEGYKTVYIDGLAASIASVIAMAGDVVIMQSGTQMMIHKPWSWIVGDSNTMRKTAAALDKAEGCILDIYMEHTRDGVTREQVQALVNAETWLTGAEAAELFNITADVGGIAAACVSDYFFDYKHTPTDYLKNKESKENIDKEKLQLALDLLSL